MVADALRGVLFQEHMAQSHQLNAALLVGVTGHHPHIGIVTGDKILDNHAVIVAGGVDLLQGSLQLADASKAVRFLLTGERVLPVKDRIGRFKDIGSLEGRRGAGTFARPINKSFRISEPPLLAEAVKALLVEEEIDKFPSGVRGDNIIRVATQKVATEADIVVAAADKKNYFITLRSGKALHMLHEAVGPVILRTGVKIDDIAVVTGPRSIFTPDC